MQPNRASRGRELGCILQQVRNDALNLGHIESELGQFLVRQEVQRQPLLLEASATTSGKLRTDRR